MCLTCQTENEASFISSQSDLIFTVTRLPFRLFSYPWPSELEIGSDVQTLDQLILNMVILVERTIFLDRLWKDCSTAFYFHFGSITGLVRLRCNFNVKVMKKFNI